MGCWKTSAVTNMDGVFNVGNDDRGSCLPQLIPEDELIHLWDASSVVSMSEVFYCSSFNQPIGDWQVHSVTDISYMFSSADLFDQPIGDWQVHFVTDMSYMFTVATSFDQPIGDWQVQEVTGMWGMFRLATSFDQCLSSWASKLQPDVKTRGIFSTYAGCTYRTQPTAPFAANNDWCEYRVQ